MEEGKLLLLNRSLGWLGQPPVNNPTTPESKSGKTLISFYDLVRKGVLARYLWNFAEVTEDTERLGDSASTYADEYIYPSDCLKLLKVIYNEGGRINDYRIAFNRKESAKVIQVNNSGKPTVKIVFNFDQKDLNFWSPLAIEVFALMLAVGGSNQILGKDNNLIKVLEEELKEMLKDAIAVDGQEQPLQIEEEYKVERARMGYSDPDDYEPGGLFVRF